MQNKKSFKNTLNNIDPTIEPCGTPEIMSLKSLQTLFTVFQIRVNIFKSIAIKFMCEGFCP